jgi:hypothetical protein
MVSGPRLFGASKATAVPCVGWLGKKRSDCLKVFGKLIVAGNWMTAHRGMTATPARTLSSAKATLLRGLKQAGRVVRSAPVVEEGEVEKRRNIAYPRILPRM